MVTQEGVLEQVIDEMQEVEPEVGQGSMAQLEFPYKDNLRISNFCRFYHPDGTWSELAAPTYNPAKPTPYRRRFIQHWLSKRGPNGEARWFFLRPQAPPPELPIRCFVKPGGRQCTKCFSNLPDLYMHVQAKHAEESRLYVDVLEAMKRKMQAQIDPETIRMLGLGEVPEDKEAPEIFYCRIDGCPRFFDSEDARDTHERVSKLAGHGGHKEKE